MTVRESPGSRFSRRSGFQRGFTAIELLVSIIVLAILATLAGPAFRESMLKQRLKGAAEGLYGALNEAKSESIKRNASVRVVATTGSPWSYCVTTGADCSGTPLASVSGSDYANINLDSSVTVTFSPLQGTANSDRFVFKNSADTARLEVRVSTLGRVRICTPSSKRLVGYEDC